MINARQLPHHSISLHIKGLIGYSTRSVDSSRQPQRAMGGQTVEFYYDVRHTIPKAHSRHYLMPYRYLARLHI